jgi:predicted RecA/RadA family phage recombinase
MTDAILRQDGERIDYTPGADVSAGDVVVQGDLLAIASVDISANTLGSLALEGIFEMPKDTGGGSAIAAGKAVYWDATNSVVTEDPDDGNNKRIGSTVLAAADADDTVLVALLGHAEPTNGTSVTGAANGYKLARGVHTTAAASDTVATGLTTVVAVCATLADDPVAGCQFVTASVGDQAGAPVAGSVLIKTWNATAAGDTTLIAATTTGKKVNWIAIGT